MSVRAALSCSSTPSSAASFRAIGTSCSLWRNTWKSQITRVKYAFISRFLATSIRMLSITTFQSPPRR